MSLYLNDTSYQFYLGSEEPRGSVASSAGKTEAVAEESSVSSLL